ncbi:hypothetical protein DDE18_14385 [Nocardioides gansuensis]|uniref:SCP domain-containing protein n=1 Tax=Nocardioides gansuensis TaxID=2138300 RepID=A0A2T8F847_9ACTN|nr:CAP domain-containing protein [Nocardioides gansuensis]PVG81898.1 hypothetical protein DDE18_14385 [Nocardioides gansuensis]
MVLLRVTAGMAATALTWSLLATGAVAAPDVDPRNAPSTLSRNTDRQQVVDDYYGVLVPATEAPFSWNGSVASCDPGAPTAAEQGPTLAAVNYMRNLAGLAPVTFSPELSARALKAALIMQASKTLTHDPTSSMACYTKDGASAAGQSNLASGVTAARAVLAYMVDPGALNTIASHRRWILHPPTRVMGSGSTTSINALTVFGSGVTVDKAPTAPEWITWPTAGYFPAPLEPDGRWSLQASRSDTDLRGAVVSVTGPGGPVPIANTATERAWVVWDLATAPAHSSSDQHYTVTISGAKRDRKRLAPFSYTVTLAAMEVRNLALPQVQGQHAVGQTLSVTPGSWAPASPSLAYQWRRNGVAIPGEVLSTYEFTAEDVGGDLDVLVTASRPRHVTTSVSTSGTAAPETLAQPPASETEQSPRDAVLVRRGVKVVGRPVVGGRLRAKGARFDPGSVRLRYSWERNGRTIKGARKSTYRLRAKDRGKRLRAVVTATKAGYAPLTVRSTVSRRVRG